METIRTRRRWPWIVGGLVAFLAVLVVAGPFIYIHFIQADPPPKLGFGDVSSTTTVAPAGTAPAASSGATTSGAAATNTASTGLDGNWKVTDGSQAGYRVNEVLFGQSTTAVGRTSDVTGQMAINATTASSADFSVDLTSVTSDQSQRDRQFQGRIMDTSEFPTATFKLTQPITFGSIPAGSNPVNVKATGDLTLRGTTKSVTVDLQARRDGSNIDVVGSIPIVFSDWNIPNPSNGPVTTQDHGLIEFLLVLAHS
jgi:polyisoprenoid-binding protein YceI